MNTRKRNFFILGNKRALSPLLATMLLLVFALIVGTITINWGKAYVEQIPEEPKIGVFDNAVVININDINTPLKELQIQYITGEITKQEYIEREKALIND